MDDLISDAATLLNAKYAQKLQAGEAISLEVLNENDSLILKAQVGTKERAHVFELKAELSEQIDETDLMMLLLDFFDGAIKEFFRRDKRAGFGLDFSKRTFDQTDIWVRQEYHDFEAERLADELLLSADGKKHPKIE